MTSTTQNLPSDGQDLPAVKLPKGRYRFFSILFGLGIFATIFAVLVLLPFKYEARVDVLVRIDRDASPVPQVGGPSSDQIVVTGVRSEDIATEISLLTSRQVAEAAYETLGPDFFMDVDEPPTNFKERVIHVLKETVKTATETLEATFIRLKMAKEISDREEAIGKLMDDLDVSKSVRSDLISLGYRAGSPEDAKKILSAIAQAYFEGHKSARAVFRGSEFFSRLRDETEAEMAALGDQIEEAKRKINVFNFPLWIEQRTIQLAQLQKDREEIERLILASQRQLFEADADLKLQTRTDEIVEPLNSNDLILSFREELGRATRTLERDIVRFGRNAQQVQESLAEIESLKTEMRAVDIAETQRKIRLLDDELAILNIRAESIDREMSMVRSEIQDVSRRDAAIRSLETRRDALAVSLSQVSEEAIKSDWLSELDARGPARITILEPITSADIPVAPNKVLILLVGIVVSFIAGLGLYILLTQLKMAQLIRV